MYKRQVFQVPWVRLEHWTADLQRVKDAGFLTAALALSEDAVTVDTLAAEHPEKLALILGTEGPVSYTHLVRRPCWIP